MRSFRAIVWPVAATFIFGVPGSAGAKIYWSNNGKIQRANTDRTQIEDVIAESGTWPRAIDIDPLHGKVYWVNGASESSMIRRANLDGSGIEDVIPLNYEFSTLAVNPISQKVYFETAPNADVWRVNADGSDPVELPRSHIFDMAVNVRDGILYCIGGLSVQKGPHRANLNGTDLTYIGEFSGTIVGSAGRLDVDLVNNKLYVIGIYKFISVNLDGSAPQVIATDPPYGVYGYDVAVDPLGGKVYWIQDDLIHRANLDGTAIEVFLYPADMPDGAMFPLGIAVDNVPVPDPGLGGCCSNLPGLGAPCVDDVPCTDCDGLTEVWRLNVSCAQVACEDPAGACCDTFFKGPCVDSVQDSAFDRTHCYASGESTRWFPAARCVDDPCNQPLGACCFASTGFCLSGLTNAGCTRFAGVQWHEGVSCSGSPCVTFCTAPGAFADIVDPLGDALQPNFADISAVVHCFRQLPGAPPLSLCDLHPCWPSENRCIGDGMINFADISRAVAGFQGSGCE